MIDWPKFKVRIQLPRALLIKCYKVARARDAIKLPHTNRQVSSRPGWEIHFDGLRSEAGLGEYVQRPELVSYSVEMTGDGGKDIDLYGKRLQVKASIYHPPYLRFDKHGSQRFSSDIAVLAVVPLYGDEPGWRTHHSWVDLIGWITRDEFFQHARPHDFGHGERLIVDPSVLQDMTALLPFLQPQLQPAVFQGRCSVCGDPGMYVCQPGWACNDHRRV